MISLSTPDVQLEQELLRRAAATGQWLLGSNPRTDPVAQVQARHRDRGVRLLEMRGRGGLTLGLAGYAGGASALATTVDVLAIQGETTPEMVRALLEFVWRFERVDSVVKVVEPSDLRERAFRTAGFREIGRLRDHSFASGRYRSQAMLHAQLHAGGLPCDD